MDIPREKGNGSISMFTQFRAPAVQETGDDVCQLISIYTITGDRVRLLLRRTATQVTNQLVAETRTSLQESYVRDADGNIPEVQPDTWYGWRRVHHLLAKTSGYVTRRVGQLLGGARDYSER